MKVLHILWTGKSGGAEIFVKSILAYSDKQKFEHAVCFLSAGGPLAEQMDALGAPVYYVGMRSGHSLLKGWKFYQLLRTFKPDLVHFHTRNYLTAFITLLFTRIKKVYSEHGGSFDPQQSESTVQHYKRFYKIFFPHFSLVLTNAEYLRQQILSASKMAPDRVKIYFYGIRPELYGTSKKKEDLRKGWGVPEHAKVVGVVGRLVPQKGIDDFIRIAAELKGLYPHCFFVVVGDGAQRKELEALAQNLKVQILFLGDRQDLTDVLSAFDIYVFTSRWEPFGIVVLEALASYLPVVGFAIPGNRAILETGGGGILIDERDPAKVAQNLNTILTSETDYQQYSSAGRKNIELNFDVRKNIQKLEQDYTSVTQ